MGWDPTQPPQGQATTSGVRANFATLDAAIKPLLTGAPMSAFGGKLAATPTAVTALALLGINTNLGAVNPSKLIGNPSTTVQSAQEIGLGPAFQFIGTTLANVATTGDVVIAGNSTSATIQANAVTYSKIQQIPPSTFLGNPSAVTANPTAIAIGTGFQFVGTQLQLNATALAAMGALFTPQGRLTLSSTLPVMNADLTAQTTIYYLPFIGNLVPVYDGAAFQMKVLGAAGISLPLNASDNASGSLYDVFAIVVSGVLVLAYGPAWTNSTTRSAAISQLSGTWVNTASIALRANGSSYGNIAANQATYLGTFYATANGQTGMAFKPAAAGGGSNAILGLYNAYNQKMTRSRSLDSTGSWTYNSATWRSADNSTSNRITWVDGLGQSPVKATYTVQCGESAASAALAFIGVNFDSTSATPAICATWDDTLTSNVATSIVVSDHLTSLGLHYTQAMEYANTGTPQFNGTNGAGSQTQALYAELEM